VHAQIGPMAANTNLHPTPTPAANDRARRRVLARPPANPRPHEVIIADAKKKHADTLAYLATH
jgi:hypothetical protein